MAGCILVVDDCAANRILFKVKLSGLAEQVMAMRSGTEALAVARRDAPAAILLSGACADPDHERVLRALAGDPRTADIPVMVLHGDVDPARLRRGLGAGAADVIAWPADEVLVLARLRALLRARQWASDPRVAKFGRGLASAAGSSIAPSASPASPASRPAPATSLVIAPHAGGTCVFSQAGAALGGTQTGLVAAGATSKTTGAEAAPDLVLLDTATAGPEPGLHRLAELRICHATRHAAIIVSVPAGDTARAVAALDMGADDVVFQPVSRAEIVLRGRAAVARKRLADRARAVLSASLDAAITDDLTDLPNRRAAFAHIPDMIAKSGPRLAVIMLDIDHFKQVNDRHGHPTGDRVLQAVSARMAQIVGQGGHLARIGGEEFLAVLECNGPGAALALAERLRAAVEGLTIPQGDTLTHGAGPIGAPANAPQKAPTPIRVTVSAGLAMAEHRSEPAAALIARADRALYAAKASGRNQVSQAMGTAA